MDEPPRDNNILGLIAITALIIFTSAKSEDGVGRDLSSFKCGALKRIKSIILGLCRIHSPNCFRLVC